MCITPDEAVSFCKPWTYDYLTIEEKRRYNSLVYKEAQASCDNKIEMSKEEVDELNSLMLKMSRFYI